MTRFSARNNGRTGKRDRMKRATGKGLSGFYFLFYVIFFRTLFHFLTNEAASSLLSRVAVARVLDGVPRANRNILLCFFAKERYSKARAVEGVTREKKKRVKHSLVRIPALTRDPFVNRTGESKKKL